MEFTNSPRATPVIHGSFAYLLGAFGDLHCVAVHSRQIMWRRNVAEDFGAELPPWGLCSTPLLADDSLIVNPGAEDASLVALGLYTGEVVWTAPGAPTAPASLILGTFGGVRQIVGYDAESLGGWDPNTGERLWKLRPDKQGDYNVTTPVNANGRLLVATKNNGTRLYEFREGGRVKPVLVAENADLAPDISTPVVTGPLVFGCSAGLFCLDLGDGLKTLYHAEDDEAFSDYAALIAGSGRILATSVKGELVLLKASGESFSPVSRLRVFKEAEVWSHPALVGDRLYIRSMKDVCCILLSGP
jgi:outer membrane protein assembly factor BamB